MLNENNRLDAAMSALRALSQPGSDLDRLSAAMPSLDGILLTGASDETQKAVEEFGLLYNSICENYPADAIHADRVDLSESDAATLVAKLSKTIEVIRDEETERILGRLRNHRGILPEAEINEMRRHRELFIPHLIKEFGDEIDRLKQRYEGDTGSTVDAHSSVPFFALYLFSEWDTVESIPVVLKGLHLPDDGPYEILGDSVHEQLPLYLAQFLSQDVAQIDSIICDPAVDTYVRWGAVNSYPYLVRDEKITAEDAVVRLERIFDATKVSDENGFPGEGHCFELSAGILDVLQKLGSSMQFMHGDKKTWNFVETSIIDAEGAGQLSAAEVQVKLNQLSPTRITDCLDVLRDWGAFNHSEPRRALKSNFAMPVRPAKSFTESAPVFEPVGTIRGDKRTPRNAKCPCGSGKKYKQCCGRK